MVTTAGQESRNLDCPLGLFQAHRPEPSVPSLSLASTVVSLPSWKAEKDPVSLSPAVPD